jgi:hypothetical protein
MITIGDKIRCVAREVAMRKSAYPRFVAAGKMKQEAAEREIAVMVAVLADLEAQRAKAQEAAA